MQAYLDSRIEVKSFNDETGEFEGYASTYGNVDNGNDMVCKGAFDDTLATGQLPALCLQHKMDNVIGEWLEMKSDAKGLLVKGKIWINKGIGDAERAWLMLKSKGPKGLSIGFIAKAAKKAANGVRMITKAALKEISVVTYPMNELAQVTSMKSEAWDELLEAKYSPDQERDDHGRFSAGASVTVRSSTGGSIRGTVDRTNAQGQVVVRDQHGKEHLAHPSNVSHSDAGKVSAEHIAKIKDTQKAIVTTKVASGALKSESAKHALQLSRGARSPEDHMKAAYAAGMAAQNLTSSFSPLEPNKIAAKQFKKLQAFHEQAAAVLKKSDDPDYETKAALQELTGKINNELVKSALRRNINNLTATSSH